MGNQPNYPGIELFRNNCQQSNKKSKIETQRRNDSSRLVSISSNYQKRLPFFYIELLEAGLHSVMEWKLKHTQIWLNLIGLSQLYPKFCQLGIDGSVLLLLDENDLKQEIGVRSVMTLGILMAWVTIGFIEFENYLHQKGILREKRKKNCEHIQKWKQMIQNVDFRYGEQNMSNKSECKISEANISRKEKRMQRSYAQSTYRNRKMPNESKIFKTEVTKVQNIANITSNWTWPESSQDMSTNRLQIMDKRTNICVQVTEVPFKMVSEMDIIYKQYGLPKNSNRKPPSPKLPQNEQQLFILDLIQNSQRRKPLCIRQLLFVPKARPSNRQPHRSKQIIDHLFKSSVEIVIIKTTNSNNMDEFRLSLMADDLLNILQNLQEFYLSQKSRQSQISKSKAIFERSIKNTYEDSWKFVNQPQREQPQNELQNDALNISLSCAETQLDCQQVSCYLLLQQPMKIPNMYSKIAKTKKQYQIFESKQQSYKEASLMDEFERRIKETEKNSLSLLYKQQQKLNHLPALNTWKFQVDGWIFEPEFVPSNTNNITNMLIQIKDKNVKLEFSPLPKDHRIDESQFFQSMQNQLFSSNSFQLFFICSGSNHQKIEVLTPHLYEPLSSWLSEPPQIKLQKLAIIIYCLHEDQFYISNFKDIDFFIKKRWREIKMKNLKDGTNKKRVRSNCIQETIYKSRGAKIQKMVQKNEMIQTIEIVEQGKYKSNRVQYQLSGQLKRQSQQQKDIWIKMPICKKSNKLNNLNSIKINKGMSIKLAGRQYIFNICSSIVQEPHEKAATSPFQFEETNQVKRSSSQYSELSNGAVRRAQLSKLNRCIICYDNESNCLFYDCMHNVTCLSCGKLLETCPMCRKRVVDHLRVYAN